MSRARIIRAHEVTPEAYRELREDYAGLLRDYISLAEKQADLYRRYLKLLDDSCPIVWPPPFKRESEGAGSGSE